MDSFEFKGVWRFPQSPNHIIAGILKFDPVEGGRLDTVGETFFEESINLFAVEDTSNSAIRIVPQNIVFDTIWGYTDKGDAVTLHRCRKIGENMAIGYVGASYSVEVIFIGCHFEREEDITFESISINYSNLEQWLGITGFSGGFNRSPKGKYLDGQILYAQPERFEIKVNNYIIAFDHSFQIAGDRFVDIRTKQFSFIEIVPDYPAQYNDYQTDVMYFLRNFLSLGVGGAVIPLAVTGKSKTYTQEDTGEYDEDSSQEEKTFRYVKIFYVAKGASLKSDKAIERFNMMFGYSDIDDDFQVYLQKWFNLSEKIRVVFDLYFSIFYIAPTYINLELLTLAQVLEAYHREIYGGTYMDDKDYEGVRQILNAAIPADLAESHRASLKNKIKYGNAYSLRKRIEQICNTVLSPYEKTVKTLVGDYKQFAEKLAATRNYLTHYSDDTKQTAELGANKHYNLVQKMKLLIQLCFMKEMGLSPDTVDRIMTKNRNFNRWSGGA